MLKKLITSVLVKFVDRNVRDEKTKITANAITGVVVDIVELLTDDDKDNSAQIKAYLKAKALPILEELVGRIKAL